MYKQTVSSVKITLKTVHFPNQRFQSSVLPQPLREHPERLGTAAVLSTKFYVHPSHISLLEGNHNGKRCFQVECGSAFGPRDVAGRIYLRHNFTVR